MKTRFSILLTSRKKDMASNSIFNYGLTCTLLIGYKFNVSLKDLIHHEFIIAGHINREEEP
jgi:hypothetical protein